MVALNMADVARAEGLAIDVARLAAELGCPVVETVAVKHDGHAGLLAAAGAPRRGDARRAGRGPGAAGAREARSSADLQAEVRRILAIAAPGAAAVQRFHHRIDAVVMHPVWGLALLAVVLFLMFQAVFSWANVPMDAIKAAMAGSARWTTAHMADGPLRSLLVDGVIAGAGSVIVFLPQILILFFFILLLEDSGYLPRAAFLLDNLMGKVGLSGRAFIPLLSSFACAIPGIMATRTIANWKDRLATIMVAPLMTCSARLPVYALLIGAFVPDTQRRPVQPARPDALRPLRRRRRLGDGRGLGLQARLDQEPLPAADARAAAVPHAEPAQPRSACGSAPRSSCAASAASSSR